MLADLPDWLARPAGALGIIAALAGSGLVFWATVFASFLAVILGGVAFLIAGLCWYAADMAATDRRLR